MKYYLFVINTEKRIKCEEEAFQLNQHDHVVKDGLMYTVISKFIDYDSNICDINVEYDD